MDDSTIVFNDNLDDDDDSGYYEVKNVGREGVIFLIDCDNAFKNSLEHVKESFLMIERIMMNGIIANHKTMVS